MKNIYCFFLAVACLMPSISNGQTAGSNSDAHQKQRETSAIFDEIMQTLPSDMKAKVDSASTIKKENVGGQTSSGALSNQKQGTVANRDDALKQLPDDVRQRVEKAISDIDVSNQDRQILFKDSKKRSAGR